MPPEAWDPFICDFPLRCRDIYDSFRQSATEKGREITLMIAMASSGFVVPFERLKLAHPARDVEEFNEAKQKFDALMSEKFIGSKLGPQIGPSERMDNHADAVHSWRYAKREQLPPKD